MSKGIVVMREVLYININITSSHRPSPHLCRSAKWSLYVHIISQHNIPWV